MHYRLQTDAVFSLTMWFLTIIAIAGCGSCGPSRNAKLDNHNGYSNYMDMLNNNAKKGDISSYRILFKTFAVSQDDKDKNKYCEQMIIDLYHHDQDMFNSILSKVPYAEYEQVRNLLDKTTRTATDYKSLLVDNPVTIEYIKIKREEYLRGSEID